MSTVWISAAYCWREWRVKAWPDEASALGHRDELVAEGLQSGLDGFAAMPLDVEAELPSAWPVAPASLFRDDPPSEIEVELSRKLPHIIAAAKEAVGR